MSPFFTHEILFANKIEVPFDTRVHIPVISEGLNEQGTIQNMGSIRIITAYDSEFSKSLKIAETSPKTKREFNLAIYSGNGLDYDILGASVFHTFSYILTGCLKSIER